MISTINVNLNDGDPVNVTCPIPPSVPFTVRLGECSRDPFICDSPQHGSTCPARPIRVGCSIGGKDWASSEVTDVRAIAIGDLGVTIGECEWATAKQARYARAACRERWALVKALVLGKFAHRDVGDAGPGTPEALLKQRDAVYAAIADKAMTEQADRDAFWRLIKTMDNAGVAFSASCPVDGDAQRGLAAYVERLIEQVGRL